MKRINSEKDLAINGATPAFDEVIHVGRPNIGSQELFIEYVHSIFNSGWLTNNGPMVQEFERRLEMYLGVKHCVTMCNGTVALEIAIRALGLSGEVIVPSFTFIATAHALQWQGITPVFADIDPVTHNLDPEDVRRMITSKTTGIIGVHLWGRATDVQELQNVADEHGLKLLFDAAHAFGCTHGGTRIGIFGDCEVFSFHATKFFNTFEGGAVTTNDDELADNLRLMRNFGFSGLDNVVQQGTNGKMIEICASMGLTNMESIEDVVELNRLNYVTYRDAFKDIPGISLLSFDETEQYNYQYIVIEVGPEFPVARDEIVRVLHEENIRARKYFWPGCHGMKLFKELYPHAGLVLPNTEQVAERVIVLPTGAAMSHEMVELVVSVFRVLSGK